MPACCGCSGCCPAQKGAVPTSKIACYRWTERTQAQAPHSRAGLGCPVNGCGQAGGVCSPPLPLPPLQADPPVPAAGAERACAAHHALAAQGGPYRDARLPGGCLAWWYCWYLRYRRSSRLCWWGCQHHPCYSVAAAACGKHQLPPPSPVAHIFHALQWDEKIHGMVEPFWILVEDSDSGARLAAAPWAFSSPRRAAAQSCVPHQATHDCPAFCVAIIYLPPLTLCPPSMLLPPARLAARTPTVILPRPAREPPLSLADCLPACPLPGADHVLHHEYFLLPFPVKFTLKTCAPFSNPRRERAAPRVLFAQGAAGGGGPPCDLHAARRRAAAAAVLRPGAPAGKLAGDALCRRTRSRHAGRI